MVPENVVDGWDNDPVQEEPFPGPENQSKMKRSVENAEHVGTQLLTINRNGRQLTLVDLGLFTPTAGQYFRNERRPRFFFPTFWSEVQGQEHTCLLPGG